MASLGWDRYKRRYGELELTRFFESKPLATLNAMLKHEINCPPASSCGRLFDAVAAAIGVCREAAGYEGQAAIELEALADGNTMDQADETFAYPFALPRLAAIPIVDSSAMWQVLLSDLLLRTPRASWPRFHKGLAGAIVAMVLQLSERKGERTIGTVALSGGVFQNKILLEQGARGLREWGFTVLTHQRVPANDGGLSLGQAIIAAARALDKRGAPCV